MEPTIAVPEGAVDDLTFGKFQSMNIERCRKAFPMCDDWTLNDWAVALAGEVGELCNLLKKHRRGLATDERYDLDGPFKEAARAAVLDELADIITYSDLMISQLSASSAEVVVGKFKEVSDRIGYRAAYTAEPELPPEVKKYLWKTRFEYPEISEEAHRSATAHNYEVVEAFKLGRAGLEARSKK